MATSEVISYDKRELRDIVKVLRSLDEKTQARAKEAIKKLTERELNAIRQAASTRTKNNIAARRIADGGKISKSSLLGEIKFGFASQRFSGGADTRKSDRDEPNKKGILGGMEFGSNRLKQFPNYSGRYGKGSRGWFIYPTIRGIQPEIIREFEQIVEAAVKEWN